MRATQLMVGGWCCCAACEFPQYDVRPSGNAPGGQAGDPPSTDGGAAGEVSASGGGLAGTAGVAGTAGLAGAEGLAGADAGGSAPTDGSPSCAAIKLRSPDLPSGPRLIDADGAGAEAPFTVYCDMATDGGGWTLLLSTAEVSALDELGQSNEDCYQSACVNRAYSTLPIGLDFRLDGSDAPIVGDAQDITIVVHGVNEALRGAALRSVLSRRTSTYIASPTSNVVVSWYNGRSCTTWLDFGGAICSNQVFVLQDPSGCNGELLALGIDLSFVEKRPQCGGWPQHPGNNFPKSFRFWTR